MSVRSIRLAAGRYFSWKVGEDVDGGGFGERLVLQVEAFERVGGCCRDGLRDVAGSRQRRWAGRGIM